MKAIFLDLDGTLIDSPAAIYQIYTAFLAKYGFEGSREEFEELNGPNLSQIVAHLKEKYGINEEKESLKKRYASGFLQVYGKVPLFEGVREFLEMTRQEKLQLALVSSAPREALKTFLFEHDLSSYFTKSISGDDVEESKPNPEIYLRALKELSLNADEVIAVEDSLNGVKAAIAANIETLCFAKQERVKNVPFYTHWQQIQQIVQERLKTSSLK